MSDILPHIVGWFIGIGIFLVFHRPIIKVLEKIVGIEPLEDDTTCECGNNSKCTRSIHSTNEGKLYIKNKEHFQCGRVQEQIERGSNFKIKEREEYVDDSDWENANLSQGDPSDINHQYSNHPHSLYQRRRRR